MYRLVAATRLSVVNGHKPRFAHASENIRCTWASRQTDEASIIC